MTWLALIKVAHKVYTEHIKQIIKFFLVSKDLSDFINAIILFFSTTL
jgi:hypothetical protein